MAQAQTQKHYFNTATRHALVSNKNVILYYHYLNNLGNSDKNGAKLGDQLFHDHLEKKALLDKNEWCTLEEFVGVVDKAISLTDNFDVPKIVGALLPQYQKEYHLQEFKDAAKQNLKAFFFGPIELFRHISFFNHLFNQTKDMEFISGRNGECLIKTKFRPGINPVYDYYSEKHIAGMLNSILDLFNLNNGMIFSSLKEYDLPELIRYRLPKLMPFYQEKNDAIYLDNELIAKKIGLEPDKKTGLFLGQEKKYDPNDTVWGWKILKDVYLDDKYLVLCKNEIYNAPYFITRISWDKHNFFKIMRSLSQAKISKLSPLGKGYARLIEERQKKEKAKIMLRAERQKIEKEYHQLLLRDYIHPRFIQRAKISPIPFANILSTNLFIDINDSTILRKQYGNASFRSERNLLLKLIKRYLSEEAGEWGWINKVLGDGCYVVLGAYNYFQSRQDLNHARQAVRFAVRLRDEVLRLNQSGILADFSIRIGMETGETEIGEIFENEALQKESAGISFGNVRFFDTDGHSVNIAKRIEGMSKILVTRQDRSSKNGIFIGPKLKTYLLNFKEEFNVRDINLEKLGISLKDYPGIKSVGEVL